MFNISGNSIDTVKLTEILRKYKAGKANLERRVISAENWWKLRNSFEENRPLLNSGEFACRSAWLHNVIVSKHADGMDDYPEPNILPREEDDREEAELLSEIIPVVLEQNSFEETWSDVLWQKLKTGTGVYKVTWDRSLLNGLGDIRVERVDLLNLFWEPGVTDIQKSEYFFHTQLWNRRTLEQAYPELKGRLQVSDFEAARFLYDDRVCDDGKVTVIDCYHKEGGRLEYVKYVGNTVLYATENSEFGIRNSEFSPAAGLYEHGMYPFVFDPLFPVEGSPCGYGFVDICSNAQTQLDLMKTAYLKNILVGAVPRYFSRVDGSINEEELMDLTRPIIHADGNLGQDSLRIIDYRPLPSNAMSMLTETVNELRETTGNTETATGTVHSGVTAASAIAALQEASGKGSRDSTRGSYRAYSRVIELCIELIRQFYTAPRCFRITGKDGYSYVNYSNAGLRPRSQGSLGGMDLGMRRPVFDIRVEPEKKNAYTKLSQNELALQLYNAGLFAPGREREARIALGMMEFDGKQRIMDMLNQEVSYVNQQ